MKAGNAQQSLACVALQADRRCAPFPALHRRAFSVARHFAASSAC